jgi:hypothetical protein
MLSVIIFIVILSVVMLSVVMLNVVAPFLSWREKRKMKFFLIRSKLKKKGSKPQILLAALAARRHLGLTPHPCPPRSTGPWRRSFQTRRSSRKDRQKTEDRHSNPFFKCF